MVVVKSDHENLFGKRLKMILAEKKLTQRDLGNKLGISYRTVNVYCQGKNYPTVEGLIDICNVLNINADFLLGLTNEIKEIQEEDNINEEILIIRQAYTNMSDKQKQAIIDLLKSITNP